MLESSVPENHVPAGLFFLTIMAILDAPERGCLGGPLVQKGSQNFVPHGAEQKTTSFWVAGWFIPVIFSSGWNIMAISGLFTALE